MRCNNCGLDYIADNAANCPRCNAPMQMGYQQPPQQYQQPPQQYADQQPQYQQPAPQQYADQQQQPQYQQPAPQGGYYAPPQGGYYQQPPMPPKRVVTVKKVDLAEILMVVSGMFLLAGAFSNFAWIADGVPAGIVVLGIVSLIGALVLFVEVLMPAMFKQLGEVKDILVLVLALVFIIWGLVATFADTVKYGVSGTSIFVGGFGLLVAAGLRMGILK
ncbi:MAG: hypothetical protein AB9860_05670 [Methanomassiliicoccales archaeon]